MRADSGIALGQLRADGGAAGNDLLLQFQADLLGVPVMRPVRPTWQVSRWATGTDRPRLKRSGAPNAASIRNCRRRRSPRGASAGERRSAGPAAGREERRDVQVPLSWREKPG